MSVWISEQSPRQYSAAVLMTYTFGTPPSARCRSSRPPVSAGERVGLRIVGERHQVADARLRLVGRLGEAVVELAAPGAGHLGQQAVEDLTAVLVQVQAEVEEVAQEAAALRDAVAVGLLDAAGAGVALSGGAVVQERRKSRTASSPVPTTGQSLVRKTIS